LHTQYLDSCFQLVVRLQSKVFADAFQAFVHGQGGAPSTEPQAFHSWDIVGKWDFHLPIEFFESE